MSASPMQLIFKGMYPDGRRSEVWRSARGKKLILRCFIASGVQIATNTTPTSLVEAQLMAHTFWQNYLPKEAR